MIDEAIRARAWRDTREKLFSSAAPSPSQVLLSIGAQPGAGKTRALDSSLRRFYPGQSFVQVIGDDLRRQHPAYAQLCASPDPELMPRQTAELSAWLVGQALEYAAAHSYSTVVEGTLRRPETTLGTIHQFATAGASTHLVVLGVSPADSWTGCIDRYLSALEVGQAARWTTLEAHDAGLEGTPGTLRAAESDPAVHHISVVDRSGTVHYDNTRSPDGAWRNPARAVEMLEKLRQHPTDPQELAARIEALAERAARLGAPTSVRAGIERARELAQHKPTAVVGTKAEVLEALHSKARAHTMEPRANSVARNNAHRL
ncbi:UDP-N-acetylglucosamine kinase [Actinomyces bovis]|uniref:UDP-N-acetylglucosamine kinase n=1 Tax=Actinomyces bovis TaxID=1658 RepID=A0ABY1VNK5_9ACTO|nr:zeta toxin family protein [Actinomyces bovis]SPT53688.1 UDP-N-acetylglucosamine kinase [Actinomyces bovis]VEG55806.1 UDP-N-acetylglucosamine kinase [Actinomyces israelii]